jgi:uncharacterized protein
MREFVLKLQDIDDSGKHYAFRVDSAWMDAALKDDTLSADPDAAVGSFEVHASRSGNDVLVQGQLHTRVVATCSRCLGAAPIDVDTAVVSLMTCRSAVAAAPVGEPGAEVELTEEDMDRDFFSGDDIVLDDIVRQHILLECPMQPLCAESCEGIEIPAHLKAPEHLEEPVRDDSGRAVDPRLAPLMKIAQELDPESDDAPGPKKAGGNQADRNDEE